MMDLDGSCLCGQSSFHAEGEPIMAAHCYCVDCRKTGGSTHGSHVAMPSGGFRADGPLASYDHPADSGNMLTRHFCSNCGSQMYTTNTQYPDLRVLRISALDDPDAVAPMMTVYASRAPKWAKLDPDLPQFPEMPEG